MGKVQQHFIGAALLCLSISPGAIAQELPKSESVQQTGKLTISNSLAYAPFEFVDAGGKPAGLDIDLANAAAKALGVDLEIITMPFSSQIASLASARARVAWATFSVTEERLRQVDFITFLQSSTVLVTTPNKVDRFKTKEDLCGAKIAIQTGSAADLAVDKLNQDCAAAGKPSIEKAIYPEQKDTIQAVAIGRVDGRFDDSTAAGYLETESKGKFVVAPGAYFPTPLGVAVAKGDTQSAKMMQAVFQKLMAEGTYDKILKQYSMSISAINKSEVITDASQLAKN